MRKFLLFTLIIITACITLKVEGQDGTLDKSFGINGKVMSKVSGTANFATCIAVQKSGKIIVGGYSWQNGYEFTLIRYLPNGTIDSTFGTNGTQINTYFNTQTFAYSLKILDDGRIVLAGNTFDGFGHYAFIMARYTEEGQIDYSFGDAGVAVTYYPSDNYVSNVYAVSIAIQSNGKYLLCGHLSHASSIYFAMLRYNTNGQVDSSFGNNGWVTTEFKTAYNTLDYATNVLTQSDNKIILTGNASYASSLSDLSRFRFALARYNENGTPDSTFGNNGQITTPYQAQDVYVNSSLLQNDNKIVLAGGVGDYSSGIANLAIARYLSNGNLDSSFGKNGIGVTHLKGTDFSAIKAITLQSNGKILACGGSDGDFVLVRYNINGSLDSSFGKNGQVFTDFGTEYDDGNCIALQTDGKILVAGDDGYADLEMARYKNDQSVLAINILNFTASLKDNLHTLLNWTTSSNNSNQTFVIQRSTNGVNFSDIHSVNSTTGNTYSFLDNFSGVHYSSGVLYYRLLTVDAENSSSYSQIEKVNIASKTNVLLFPDPVKTSINLFITTLQNEKADIRIINGEGKIVYAGRKDLMKGSFNYSIDASLFEKGMYFIQFTTQDSAIKISFLKN